MTLFNCLLKTKYLKTNKAICTPNTVLFCYEKVYLRSISSIHCLSTKTFKISF